MAICERRTEEPRIQIHHVGNHIYITKRPPNTLLFFASFFIVFLMTACFSGFLSPKSVSITITPIRAAHAKSHYAHMGQVYFYDFTEQEIDQMEKRIAGKSKEEAEYILKQLPGVQAVTVSGDVPSDPSQIRFVVLP